MLKHYIQFFTTPICSCSKQCEEISKRSIDLAKRKASDCCLAFRFYDQDITIENGEIIIGSIQNLSGWYFFGEELPFQEIEESVEAGNPEYSEIYHLMKANNVKSAVKTDLGIILKLGPKDMIISRS